MAIGHDVDRLKRLTRSLDWSESDRDVMTELRWDDMQGPPGMGNAAAALDFDPVGDAGFYGYCFASTTTDTVYFMYQMTHRWAPGTEARCHVHFVPLADPAAPQGIAFHFAYAWSRHGARTPKPATWTTGSVIHTVNPTTDWDAPVSLDLFQTTPAVEYQESSFLRVKLWRKHDDTGDTYTTSKGYGTGGSNVEFQGMDVHVQLEKTGTTEERH